MWSPLPLCLLSMFVARLADCSPLVPFKTPTSILARSTWKRALAPRDAVSLFYAPAGSSSPSSSLTFTAHQDLPILLLEDIEFLVEAVWCHYSAEEDVSVIEITFASEDAYDATLAAWSSLPQFMLVTSHRGCNPHDQRGAWLVTATIGATAIVGNLNQRIVLQVQQIPLRAIGWSFHISHAADGTSSWGSPHAGALHGRDVDSIFSLDPGVSFSPRQQLLPVSSNTISSLDDQIPDPAGVQVFCTDCGSVTDIAVGIEVNVENNEITEAYINVTVTKFQQDIQLEISFNDTYSYQKDFDVLVLPFPDLGISVPDVATVGFFFGGAVRMDLEIAAALNFTVGASASIPSGATGMLVLSQLNQSSASGWDQATFNIHPFRLNSGTLKALTGGISLSPFLEATLSVADGILSPAARVYMNTPYVHAAANLATNVNRQCETLGPNDFEFFDSALTFGAGLNISIDGTLTGAPFDDHDMTIYTKALPFGDFPSLAAPVCMVIVDDDASAQRTSSLAGQVSAPTGTLLPAAQAIPSFNVAGIQSYYSANGALPTNVNYSQMLQATAVPDDIKKAVQKAGALGRYAMATLVSCAMSMTFGGLLVSLF
ncbi:hypothetical protein GGX14DRAFT_482495 [Mycena pura]|uniref:Uncharacterized protein n=1 Tax=Mycena pura TaxID=153505 RepID=A0AAD6XYG4_9AGAR|nr:hypothetical protein GGX14DRAFT_482495 [Mycena pura]